MNEPLISLENVGFAYDGKPVLSNVSFSICPGDFICIVGENGAGKSTLIKGLLGLKKPAAGRIVRSGGLNGIGYLPQANNVQGDFPAGVREVVQSGLIARLGWRAFFTRSQNAAVDNVLESFHLKNLADRSCRTLSGGQLRRVLIARAFCASRALMVLDEPAAGLDTENAGHILSLIEHLNQCHGTAVVLVTHDPETVAQHARRVITIKDGRAVVRDNTPGDAR